MKPYFVLSILSIGSLLLQYCHTMPRKQLQEITIDSSNNLSANLSYFVKHFEIIKLERNDSNLIAGIRNLEVTKDYVFINDGKNIHQFDWKGKYIRKVGQRGRGPHEYQSISCFTYSERLSRLYIGTLGKILIFDFQGNFISEIVENKLFDYLKAINGQLWAFFTDYEVSGYNGIVNQTKVYLYSIFTGIRNDSIILKSINLKHQVAVYSPKMQYLSVTTDKMYLYCPILFPEPILRDTLYYVEDKLLIPAVKLNFNGIFKLHGKEKNVIIKNINRTNRYLFTEYNSNKIDMLFIHDFSENKNYNLPGGVEDDIFKTGKVFIRPLNLNSNQVYFTKNGYELIGKIDSITEDSNPIIFYFKLKD